jgi:hypothetical protein
VLTRITGTPENLDYCASLEHAGSVEHGHHQIEQDKAALRPEKLIRP